MRSPEWHRLHPPGSSASSRKDFRDVKRFPAFDPPEYVGWKPDPALVRGFRQTIEADDERATIVQALSHDAKLELYRGLLRARLHDIQLKRWVRTGVISKAWLGTGEEATTVGPVHALTRGTDIVAPMIRNAGACCEMGMSIADMLRAYLATADSPSSGRDLHVGSFTHGVLQPISHVGDMVPVITGIALTFKIRKEPRVALTWVGDGSTKTAAAPRERTAEVQRVPPFSSSRTIRSHSAPGSSTTICLPTSRTGRRAMEYGARCSTATMCSTPMLSHELRPSGVVVETDLHCSLLKRSEWVGTPRTMSAKRAKRFRRSCLSHGANVTRLDCTRST
jgi:hypothetical protein